jgi:hypothetical protein
MKARAVAGTKLPAFPPTGNRTEGIVDRTNAW